MPNQDDFSPPRNPNFLKKQLERARFERAIEVAQSLVEKGAFLNTAELARINNILTGSKEDAWREGAVELNLPSGNQIKFAVLADPQKTAHEILRHAKDRAAAGDAIDAAADLYVDLVMNHIFKDANRRCAVVATSYLLKLYGYEVSPTGLHDLGLGDVRASGSREALRELVRNLVKVAQFKK